MLISFEELAAEHDLRIDRVIHAGGHLGEEAPAYQQAGAREVLWIEGNPDLIPRLTTIVAPYGHHVVQALVGAEAGREVTFHVSNFDSMSSSVLEFGTHERVHAEVIFVGEQSLRLQTLDAVAEANGFLGADFINLDLQGYELECLKGAERVIAGAGAVYSEVNVDELYKGCVLLPELDSWLNEHGFEARQVRLYGSSQRGAAEFVGWGDCFYLRVDQPRPFSRLHPAEAAEWFGTRGLTGTLDG
jgi:FkbM family methyltransferase